MGNSGQSKFLSIVILVVVGAVTRVAVRNAFSSSNSSSVGSSRSSSSSTLSKLEENFYEDFKNDKNFQDHFKGLDRKASYEEGMKLASRGLRRLSTEELVQRARVLQYVLEHTDEKTCAGISMGGKDGGELFAKALESVPEDMQKDWVNLAVRAVKAELAGGIYIEPITTDVKAGFAELAAKLTTEEKLALQKLSAGGIVAKSSSSKEICSAGKSIFRSIPQLSSRSQDAVAHAMAAEPN